MNIAVYWFLAGLICAIVGVIYDSITTKVYVDKNFFITVCLMILLGFISIPITLYLLVTDIKDNIKQRRNRFW